MVRFIAMLWLSSVGLVSAAETYVFGVAPQFEQRKLFAIWKPVLDELEKRTGVQFRFASTFSVQEFEQVVGRGEYDFVYVNPYHLYKQRTRHGYVPLVRDQTPLRGIVTVRKDSPIKTVQGLDGKTLAVPSPNAIGASMLVRAELERAHDVKIVMVNAKSHSSAYLYAINKLADAAGGVEKTFVEQDKSIQDALQVLFTTRDFPSHPIAAHPRIPEKLQEQVRQAFLAMSASGQAESLLGDIPMSKAIPATLNDYMVLRTLNLDAYWIDPPAAKP